MGKDNNLTERPTLSIEFHLPKRGCIYGFGTPPLPLFSLSLFRGGERLLRHPLDPPLIHVGQNLQPRHTYHNHGPHILHCIRCIRE